MLSRRTVFLLVLLPVALSGLLIVPQGRGNHSLVASETPISPNAYFDHVLVVYMENKNIGDIVGSSNAPYETTLAHDYAYSQSWHQVSNSGSEPEYLAAISANTFDSVANPSDPWGGCNSQPSQCSSWPAGGSTTPTLAQLFEPAGISWKAYMENATSNCQQADAGTFATRHDPWVWFSFAQPSQPDCGKVIPAGKADSAILTDLNSRTASSFMWLTPDEADNMHDPTNNLSAAVHAGDVWLSGFIPKVLNSYTFKTDNRSAVFILWDEGSSSPYVMPAIFAGPAVRNNYTSTTFYNQYSLPKTIEDQWGLSSLNSNDAAAADFSQFFKIPQGGPLQPRFSYSPSQPYAFGSVTFNANATLGGTPPYSFTWRFGDGWTATGAVAVHSYTSAGSYSATVVVRDSTGNTANSSQTLTVNAQPPFAIDPLGSWNPLVSCANPWILRISDLTDNMTGANSLGNSTFAPGIQEPGGVNLPNSEGAKRWLPPGLTPTGWVSPGPGCTITNSKGQTVASFVEIDGVGTGSLVWESDCLQGNYDPINGGSPAPAGHWCDDTFNIFDPAIVPNYVAVCETPTDPTCYGVMHVEFDQDWMAAGYCGPSTTTCNNSTLAGLINPGSPNTLFDLQGFVFWDPQHVAQQSHFFSGWELHALTAWRVHVPNPANTVTPEAFTNLVVIPLENRGFSAVYGSSCAGNCTYITQLSNTYGLAENYSGVAHNSAPNYLTLTSGDNFSYQPYVADCWPNSCPTTDSNLVDELERAGLTWKAYIEDYPVTSGCVLSPANSTMYAPNHNPIIYYNDVNNNATRCARIVNANPGASGFLALPSALLSDLNSTSPPNFMWLTPNQCDDGHGANGSGSGCYDGNGVDEVNRYLSLLVPKILNSKLFTTQKAALFITWDEGGACPTLGQTYPACTDRVAGIWIGPNVKPGYKSTVGYSHYSLTRTIETVWNLASPTSIDACVSSMTEFFIGFQAGSTCSQSRPLIGQTVTFAGIAQGGFAPYKFRWNFGDSATATGAAVSHSYASAGNYKVTFTVSDFYNNTVSSTTTVKVASFGVTISPNSLTLLASSTGTLTVTVTGAGNFTGSIALSDLTSPFTGLTCGLNPTTVSISTAGSSASSTLSCNGFAGTYSTSVAVVNGATSITGRTFITVQDFIITASPVSITTNTNVPATSTVNVGSLAGFNGTVGLTVLTNSTKLACNLSPTSVSGGSRSSSLSCTGSSAGNYLATITGADGTLSHSATAVYHVQDFTLTGPVSLSVNSGASGNAPLVVASQNGFAGTVTLSISTNSTSLICSLSVTSVPGGFGSSTLSCQDGSAGNFLATVTGTSSTLSRSASIVVVVQDFSLGTNVTNITENTGISIAARMAIAPVNGFSGTVTLTSATNSTSLSCSLSPSSLMGSSGSSILSCSSSFYGNYLVTVTGQSGLLVHTVSVVYHVQDFSVLANPSSITVYAGAPANSTIMATSLNGFAGVVNLSTNSTVCTIFPTSASGSGSSSLSCTFLQPATFHVAITGTSSSLVHSVTVTYTVQDFMIIASPASVTINAGMAGNSTVVTSALNGFAGTLGLSSNSTSCAITPSSSNGPASARLSCTFAGASIVNVAVTAKSGSLSHSTVVKYIVQDFTITPVPTIVTTLVGSIGSSNVTVTSLDSFSGNVTLSANSSSCVFSSTSLIGPASATLSCRFASSSTFNVTVTGASANLSHMIMVSFVVQDFTTAASPTAVTASAGTVANSTVTLVGLNGFSGIASLASNSTSCTLSPTAITGSGSSMLSCRFATAGLVSVVVTATAGPLSHSVTVAFRIQDFTIAESSTGITVLVNQPGASTISVASLDGFAGPVNLSANNTSCSVSPNPVTGAGNTTVSCGFALAGIYQITVHATSGSLSHQVTVSYTVQDFAISPSPTGVTVNVGSPGGSSIVVTGLDGFPGVVNLALNNTSCNLSSNSVTGSGSVALSCVFSNPHVVNVAVNATSNSLFHTVVVFFTVRDFVVSSSVTSITTNVGSPGSATILINRLDGFDGVVALAANSTSCTVTPTTVSGLANSTLSCSFASASTFAVTVSGSSLSLSRSVTVSFTIQDFALKAAGTNVVVDAGSLGSSNLTTSGLDGFAGLESLSSNSTACTISPSSLSGSGSSTLSCSFSTAQVVIVMVTARSGLLSHLANVTFTVQDFTIGTPSNVSIPASTLGNATVSAVGLHGFTGLASLHVTLSPATGLTCSLNPSGLGLNATVSSASSLLSCSGSLGTYTVTIVGNSRSLSHSSVITYHVTDYSVSPVRSSVSLLAGLKGGTNVTISPLNGFTGNVFLTVSPPAGLSCSLTSSSIALGGVQNSSLSCSGSAGVYSVIVSGFSGGLSRSAIVSVTVQDFSVSTSPTSLNVNQGSSKIVTLTISGLDGFTGNVSIVVSSSPGGPPFGPVSANVTLLPAGSAMVNVTFLPSFSSPTGSFQVNVTGVSGPLTHSTQMTVTIQPSQIVGGTVLPVAKLALLVPYLESSLIVLATIAGVIACRWTRKRRMNSLPGACSGGFGFRDYGSPTIIR